MPLQLTARIFFNALGNIFEFVFPEHHWLFKCVSQRNTDDCYPVELGDYKGRNEKKSSVGSAHGQAAC